MGLISCFVLLRVGGCPIAQTLSCAKVVVARAQVRQWFAACCRAYAGWFLTAFLACGCFHWAMVREMAQVRCPVLVHLILIVA